jgi:hypothetical protein
MSLKSLLKYCEKDSSIIAGICDGLGIEESMASSAPGKDPALHTSYWQHSNYVKYAIIYVRESQWRRSSIKSVLRMTQIMPQTCSILRLRERPDNAQESLVFFEDNSLLCRGNDFYSQHR